LQLGKTEGIITILRGVPHNASRLRKVYIPVSVLTEHQVSSESLIRNTVDQEKMKILVESMAAVADDHLGTIHILPKNFLINHNIFTRNFHEVFELFFLFYIIKISNSSMKILSKCI
jgi:hypothetical protein